MADMGYIALFLALVASIYSAIAYIFGVRGRQPALIKSAKCSLLITFGLVSASATVLLISLLTHNFQIEYVASYTSRDLHPIYLLSAFWAGNDGSLLFWAWLLSLFATVVLLQRRAGNREMIDYASVVIMLTEAFFSINYGEPEFKASGLLFYRVWGNHPIYAYILAVSRGCLV